MSLILKPVFVKDDKEYAFEGLNEDQRINRGANMEFRFIVNTLRAHLGDDLDFKVEHGLFSIPYNEADKQTVLNIYQNTNEFPVAHAESHLKFVVIAVGRLLVEEAF